VLGCVPVPTQGERSEATRTKLLGAARKLFRARGYADTSLDDIAARAGVTKGAFYHHFEDKKAIFTAVFEEAERELVEAAAAGRRGGDVWTRFRAGCGAFLEASMEPGIQRVALHDAPVVLGWEVWREIAERHSLGVIEAGLERAMAAGQVRSRPTKPLARLLFGALCEGARMVARAADPRQGLAEVVREVDELLAGMLIQSSATREAAPDPSLATGHPRGKGSIRRRHSRIASPIASG
jgi:AcrR family transcriptional regulator